MRNKRQAMKATNKIPGASVLLLVMLFMIACEEPPTGPDETIGAARRSAMSAQRESGSIECGNQMGNHYSEAAISRQSGGTLQFTGGMLIVPPDSIDADKTIWSRVYRLSGTNIFRRIYEFGPSGTVFSPEAELIISYVNLGPVMPNSIELKVFNETTRTWEVASHMTNQPANRQFIGPIGHFSKYSLSGNGQTLFPPIEDEE